MDNKADNYGLFTKERSDMYIYFKKEGEILYKKNSSFEVLKIENKSGMILIYMAEV